MKKHCVVRSVLALLLVISMIAGFAVLPASAAEAKAYNYVSIGASNTNGYGLRGYITEEEINGIVSGTLNKDDVNVYGYHRCPEGSYPDLVADYLKTLGGTVNHEQLAMSSMRAEEVRVLLDNDYYGDKYTSWRFIKDDGSGWFNKAEPAGLEALRKSYQTAVANADLITLDIGWHNFGVYVCNRLTSYLERGAEGASFEADLTKVLGEGSEEVADEIVQYIMDEVSGLLTLMGGGLAEEDLHFICETFAYALVGYIVNFDIIVGKIYDANPDVDLVVLGIQNLLHGAEIVVGEDTLPLGNVYGEIVSMANVYISEMSPYADKYMFTMTGNDDHVTTFLDEIALYNGKPTELNVNIKDCYDIYDEDMMVKYMLQYLMGEMYKDELADMGVTAAGFVAAGEAGKLPKEAEGYYQQSLGALNQCYDSLSEVMQHLAKTTALDSNGIEGMNAAEDALGEYLEDVIIDSATAGMTKPADGIEGKAYNPDLSIFDDSANALVGVINTRFYTGNSFFAHPSNDGHKEIYDDVLALLKGGKNGTCSSMFEKQLGEIVEMIDCDNTNHHMSPLTWTWAKDNASATFGHHCYRCDEAASAEGKVTSETTDATCTTDGKTVYTAKATLGGKEYTDTKEVVIPAGHTYTATWMWADDYSSASVSLDCSVCDAETKVVSATVTTTEDEGDCETPSSTTYTATAEADGKKYTDSKVVTGTEPGGHVYGDPVWTWADDLSTAKVSRTCSVCEEVIEAEAEITTVIDPKPTCDTDGKATLTAKATLDGTEFLSVKEQVVPAAHSFKDGVCTVCGEKESPIVRISGKTRYETAFETADELKAVLKVEKFDTVIVTSGTEFADALSGSYLATVKKAPILLVGKNTMDAVYDYIEENVAADGMVYILGGSAAVDSSFEAGLPEGMEYKRLKGANRYATNLEILKEAGVTDEEILVCTGLDFADSLSASALGKPILLVRDTLTDAQEDFLKSLDGDNKIYVIGGEAAVSKALMDEVDAYGDTVRIKGKNRNETSVMLAHEFLKKPTCAVLAYSRNFPDGLCGGPLAYALGAPLVLTQTGEETVAAAYAEEYDVSSGYVLGGSKLISDASARKILGQPESVKVIER